MEQHCPRKHILETERQFKISRNGIITTHRGDTFTVPVCINVGSGCQPKPYDLKPGDVLYLGLLEPGQRWEKAILKKTITYEESQKYPDEDPTFYFRIEDTEYLVPGNYYYEVKLYRAPENCEHNLEHVDTIIPRTKFVILE